MTKLALFALFITTTLASSGCKGGGGSSTPVSLTTDDQKILYALGLSLGRSIAPFHLSSAELDIVKAGLSDMVSKKKPQVELEAWGPKIRELAKKRQQVSADEEKAKAKAYFEQAAKGPGAVALPSGLVFKTLSPGTGDSPQATDHVKVHYHGTLIDGTVFDSSVKRGQPAEFSLSGVIPCWTEGVQRMKVGEKAMLICPSSIAYGDMGRPPTIPGGATLRFEIELLSIEKAAPPANPLMSAPGFSMPPGHPGMTGAQPMPLGRPTMVPPAPSASPASKPADKK